MLEVLLLCAGCHGINGEGRPHAGYPRLAAQPQAYLERQLAAYADGRRKSVVMEPLAKRLSAQERSEAAAHFAQSAAPQNTKSGTYPARGRTLAVLGDNALRVQACQNCHGPDGSGLPPYGAYLAGLHASYLEAELRAWKSGRRATDPSGAMRVIARNLDEADIAAVAAYYAALPAPSRSQDEPMRISRPIALPGGTQPRSAKRRRQRDGRRRGGNNRRLTRHWRQPATAVGLGSRDLRLRVRRLDARAPAG